MSEGLGRWEAFNEAERALIKTSLLEYGDGIVTVARVKDAIPEDEREAAAGSLLVAAALALDIDEAEGNEHPPLEVFELTAGQIADGTFADEITEALAQEQQAAGFAAAREAQVEAALDDDDRGRLQGTV